MEFRFVDTSNLEEKDLIEILDHNVKCASLKKAEIAKLKAANESSTDIKNIESVKEEVKKESSKEDVDLEFEEEVDYYLSEFRALDDSELETELEDTLPVRKNYHYKNIIMRMIAELNRDIKDINEIIVSDMNSLSKTELKEYNEEISRLRIRISALKNALIRKENKEENEETVDNILIFTPTQSGNIRIFDDLSGIPTEYYPSFLEIIQSIKDGSFKGIKRFINNDILKGALEVRGFKVRVVFTRLDKNVYAVLTAFVKKTNNDRGYRRPLEIKVSDYKANLASKLKESIKNDAFIEENKLLEKELFNMLGQEDKEVKEKKKVGDK